MSPVYKHAAPLGLQKKGKRENGADSRLLYTLRSAGAEAGIFFDLSCINPILHTCRPAGAKSTNGMLPGFDLRYHIALRWSAGVGLIALAIDMSLLWSERQNRIAMTDMSAIVGARFPSPAGWGTQPLRIQRCGGVLVFYPCNPLNPTNP